MVGDVINFRGLVCAPLNENGVILGKHEEYAAQIWHGTGG